MLICKMFLKLLHHNVRRAYRARVRSTAFYQSTALKKESTRQIGKSSPLRRNLVNVMLTVLILFRFPDGLQAPLRIERFILP